MKNTGIIKSSVRGAHATDRVVMALKKNWSGVPNGGMLPSERSLAGRLGVSRVTIRRALDRLKRDSFVHSRTGKGLFRGPSDDNKSSFNGQAVVLSLADIDYYSVNIVRRVLKEAETHGIRVFPHSHTGNVAVLQTFLESLPRQNGVSGVILQPPLSPDKIASILPHCHRLRQAGIRVVMLNTPSFKLGFDHVGFDDCAGMAMITRHMLDRGHRRIVFVAAKNRNLRSAVRQEGYQRAMKAVGRSGYARIVYAEQLSHDIMAPEAYEFSSDPVELVRRHGVTAFAAHNENIAFGLFLLLQSAGIRVPADVSLAGYDHLDHVRYTFPFILTTSLRDRELLGTTAFHLLYSRIISGDAADKPRDVLLPVQMITGESVTTPKEATGNSISIGGQSKL